jgi:hypothetical protein
VGRQQHPLHQALRRHGAIEDGDELEPEAKLAASAVSGQTPPAGPQWTRGLLPAPHVALAYDKPLCASLDGFTLHAATHAGALDVAGREALLRYVLRPPIAQERVEPRPDGLVASPSSVLTRTGRSPSTSTRSRSSAASPRACCRRDFTP